MGRFTLDSISNVNLPEEQIENQITLLINAPFYMILFNSKSNCEMHFSFEAMLNLNMIPEAELAFFMLGAGHMVNVPNPSLPN